MKNWNRGKGLKREGSARRRSAERRRALVAPKSASRQGEALRDTPRRAHVGGGNIAGLFLLRATGQGGRWRGRAGQGRAQGQG